MTLTVAPPPPTSREVLTVAPPPPQMLSVAPPPPKALPKTAPLEGEIVPEGMLCIGDYHPYQHQTVEHMVNHPESMIWLALGLGKEQPLTTPIKTLNGWSTMGEMRAGLKLPHPKGGVSTVISVHPQGRKRVYELELSDGRVVECGREHLWTVQYPSVTGSRSDGSRKHARKTGVFTTEQLMSRGYTTYKVQPIERLDYPEKELSISPYLLGALIADGSYSENSGSVFLSYYNDDTFIRDRCVALLPDDVVLGADRSTSTLGMQCTFKDEVKSNNPNILRHELDKLGLGGTASKHRFIPQKYLHGSFFQRLELLHGLMDCDGSIGSRNRKSYATKSKRLVSDMRELVYSLGGTTGVCEHLRTGREHKGFEYHISITFNDLNPFSLPRKAAKVAPITRDRVSAKIKNIRKTDRFEEQQCISIDNPDGLYVTTNYIVTHNTITTLDAFLRLREAGVSRKMLVVAPLRVCELQWEQEANKWTHTKGKFKFAKMIGAAKKRQAALFSDADIYLVNYESLTWLSEQLIQYFVNQNLALPFDVITFDEMSKMKREQSIRFRNFAPICELFERKIGLTASPASNGLSNLWAQYYCLDAGLRLGAKYKMFQERFFNHHNEGNGDRGKWFAKTGARDAIIKQTSDVTLEIPAEGNIDMPPLTTLDIYVTLPAAKMKQYLKLEREFFVELENGAKVELFNAAALSCKLLQMANGRIYNYPDERNPDYREIEKIHDKKYEALDDIMTESGDEPVFLAYNFESERDEIMRRYPDARCMTGVKEEEAVEISNMFNAGELKLLIAHPLSAGHGLNLQYACSIVVWFGLNYNLELYQQFIGRINRQGQKNPVRNFRIVAKDTMDVAVMAALASKDAEQEDLKQAMNDYRARKLK